MWPEPVERIAALMRAAGVQGALEELPPDTERPSGMSLRATGFDCDGRTLVALVPADRAIDRERLAAAAGCRALQPAPFPAFPFQGARVLLERSALAVTTVWVQAGSPRHYLALAPTDLGRLLRCQSADFVLDD